MCVCGGGGGLLILVLTGTHDVSFSASVTSITF